MAQNTPVDIVRQASTLSIVWGVLLIVFGMVARVRHFSPPWRSTWPLPGSSSWQA